MRKLIFCFAFILLCLTGIWAQPRMIEKQPEKKTPAAIAPVTFNAKYEGGMFGFSKNMQGTLKFDDANLRLVFFNNENKEQFGIPYKALIVLYPNEKSVQANSGIAVSALPLPGAGLAGRLIKKKLQYLVVNFEDPDMQVKGLTNFKLESAEMLASVIQTLGNKAEMQPRGDAYYRPKTAATTGN